MLNCAIDFQKQIVFFLLANLIFARDLQMFSQCCDNPRYGRDLRRKEYTFLFSGLSEVRYAWRDHMGTSAVTSRIPLKKRRNINCMIVFVLPGCAMSPFISEILRLCLMFKE